MLVEKMHTNSIIIKAVFNEMEENFLCLIKDHHPQKGKLEELLVLLYAITHDYLLTMR